MDVSLWGRGRLSFLGPESGSGTESRIPPHDPEFSSLGPKSRSWGQRADFPALVNESRVSPL